MPSTTTSTKASTMDGDKRRLFLERMKASNFFQSRHQQNQQQKQNQQKAVQNKSTGVEIMTDDEVGTVSSEDPHGHMSLFLHHQHEQQTQHFSNSASSNSGCGSQVKWIKTFIDCTNFVFIQFLEWPHRGFYPMFALFIIIYASI